MLKCGWREICKIWEAAWTQSEIGTLILLFPAEMIFNLPDIYFHYICLYFHVLNLLLFKAKIYLPGIYQTPRNCDFSCCLQKTEKLWYGYSRCYGIRPWYDVSLWFGQLQAVCIGAAYRAPATYFIQLITTFQNDNPPDVSSGQNEVKNLLCQEI